jgi:hypothetical protein
MKEERSLNNKIGFNKIFLRFKNMHDDMIMHKRKTTNNSIRGATLGRYI